VISSYTAVSRRPVHLVLALTAGLLLALLVAPAFASAAGQIFVVNSKEDTTTQEGCETSVTTDECSLRGAIEAANATPELDKIDFDKTVFDGGNLSRIVLQGGTLKIQAPVDIDAGRCTTVFGEGPCAEVEPSTNNNRTFLVTAAAPSTTIAGLAINGGRYGINVYAKDFSAVGDWFGVKLDRTGGAGSLIAVLLEPGAEGAVIGGETAATGDVFQEGGTGIEDRGASGYKILGNLFGLNPEAAFFPGRTLSVGVEIGSEAASGQVPNEIGGPRAGGAASSRCSGACNLFATERGQGVRLDGTTAPTSVRGNYFGLSRDGTAAIGTSTDGIVAFSSGPGSEELTIGGPTPATEGNLFVGGEYGVHATHAAKLGVTGNEFGYGSAGQTIEEGGPSLAAIGISADAASAGASIAGNSINAEGATGIESLGPGAEISGNGILAPGVGIAAEGDDEGVGNRIAANTITNAGLVGIFVGDDSNLVSANTIAKAGRAGIEVEGEDQSTQSEANVVVGNTVSKVGGIGIVVGSSATDNRIGGDNAGEANSIFESGGAEPAHSPFGAIAVVSRQEGRNVVAANTGSGNKKAFIQLISHGGPEEPNGGIKPPVVAAAFESSASGTAEPGSTVRVFDKASPEAGELGTLLAVVQANSAGAWQASFAARAVGTLIVATDTGQREGLPGLGTSELSSPLAAAPEKEASCGLCGGGVPVGGGTGAGSTGTPGPPSPATVAKVVPKIKILGRPKKTTSATKATFKFKATNVSGATFECRLDGAKKWASCRSPKTYKGLMPGKHTFSVRAEAGGLVGPVTKYQFTVKS
jgi:hypothetical protein